TRTASRNATRTRMKPPGEVPKLPNRGSLGDMLPSWIAPIGLVEHFLVGVGLTAVLALLGAPPAAIFVAGFSVGFAHAPGGGGFPRVKHGPWRGFSDLVAFLPAPIVWWFSR